MSKNTEFKPYHVMRGPGEKKEPHKIRVQTLNKPVLVGRRKKKAQKG